MSEERKPRIIEPHSMGWDCGEDGMGDEKSHFYGRIDIEVSVWTKEMSVRPTEWAEDDEALKRHSPRYQMVAQANSRRRFNADDIRLLFGPLKEDERTVDDHFRIELDRDGAREMIRICQDFLEDIEVTAERLEKAREENKDVLNLHSILYGTMVAWLTRPGEP